MLKDTFRVSGSGPEGLLLGEVVLKIASPPPNPDNSERDRLKDAVALAEREVHRLAQRLEAIEKWVLSATSEHVNVAAMSDMSETYDKMSATLQQQSLEKTKALTELKRQLTEAERAASGSGLDENLKMQATIIVFCKAEGPADLDITYCM